MKRLVLKLLLLFFPIVLLHSVPLIQAKTEIKKEEELAIIEQLTEKIKHLDALIDQNAAQQYISDLVNNVNKSNVFSNILSACKKNILKIRALSLKTLFNLKKLYNHHQYIFAKAPLVCTVVVYYFIDEVITEIEKTQLAEESYYKKLLTKVKESFVIIKKYVNSFLNPFLKDEKSSNLLNISKEEMCRQVDEKQYDLAQKVLNSLFNVDYLKKLFMVLIIAPSKAFPPKCVSENPQLKAILSFENLSTILEKSIYTATALYFTKNEMTLLQKLASNQDIQAVIRELNKKKNRDRLTKDLQKEIEKSFPKLSNNLKNFDFLSSDKLLSLIS